MNTLKNHCAIAIIGCLLLTSFSHCLAASEGSLPIITAQPQPQTALDGANLTLSVSAVSTSTLRYLWRFKGNTLPNNFPGQGTPVLSLHDVTPEMSGPYSVVVSNRFGAVTSQTAVVSVNVFYGGAGGYVNHRIKPGYSLDTIALSQGTTNQTVGQNFYSVPEGSSLFKVDGNGFHANNYLYGWNQPEQLITLGEGWFFHNPTGEPFTLTVVGVFVAGKLINRLPAGLSLCANILPQAGPLTTLLGLPETSGTEVFLFDESTESYSSYQVTAEGWFPSEPQLALGKSMFVREPFQQDWIREFGMDFLSFDPPVYQIVQPALSEQTGEVNFFTYHPNSSDGQVLDVDGVTPLGSQFVAQLYASRTAMEQELVPMGEPVAFLDGAGAGYIRGASVKLPGIHGGETVFLQLRAWEKVAGNTYERAVQNGSASGRSAIFSTIAHATIENGRPGLPPRNANIFSKFQISLGEAAPLRLTRIQSTPTGVEVLFPTHPGWVYCVQRCFSYNGVVAWTAVAGAEEVVGTGHLAKITDVSSQQCFYRLCRVR